MDHLDQLEQQSVYIFREAFRHFERMCMLWSIGKDSTVLLWLARKAFFGHIPFPLVHIDTSYKLPEMIQYRDRLALEYKLTMIVGQDEATLAAGATYPATAHLAVDDPRKVTRKQCCGAPALASNGEEKMIRPSESANFLSGACHSHGVIASRYSSCRPRPSQIVPLMRNHGWGASSVIVSGV